jgi:LysM repeat protein
MEYTRALKRGMFGADVFYIKTLLHELGYLKVLPTHNVFGSDTDAAVRAFQHAHHLDVDGSVGPITWPAIVRDHLVLQGTARYIVCKGDTLIGIAKRFGTTARVLANLNGISDAGVIHIGQVIILPERTAPAIRPILSAVDYPNIHPDNLRAINADLVGVSDIRVDIVRDMLKYAYDDDVRKLNTLYIIGANLYGTDLKPFHPTEAYVRKRMTASPSHFTNGRGDWIIQQIRKNPDLFASDCSGELVGQMRRCKVVSNTFDATADGLYNRSKHVLKADIIPGDWVGKPGHIGLYVGGRWSVECIGGEYGCQLTPIDGRSARNLRTGKFEEFEQWNRFMKPGIYK